MEICTLYILDSIRYHEKHYFPYHYWWTALATVSVVFVLSIQWYGIWVLQIKVLGFFWQLNVAVTGKNELLKRTCCHQYIVHLRENNGLGNYGPIAPIYHRQTRGHCLFLVSSMLSLLFWKKTTTKLSLHFSCLVSSVSVQASLSLTCVITCLCRWNVLPPLDWPWIL